MKKEFEEYIKLEKQQQEILKKLSLEESIELGAALGDAGLPI